MTDIIKSTSGLDMVASLADVLKLADTLAAARGGFIPSHFTNSAQVAAVILAGRELGVGPMAALRSFYLVNGKLGMDDMTGGTFSISNGGTFGSMLSTPIINPPQSAILGVHATKDRAVVENGQVVVRPMNYFAMSYDHRIIDGREAVLGLVAIKEAMEDPSRLLFDI